MTRSTAFACLLLAQLGCRSPELLLPPPDNGPDSGEAERGPDSGQAGPDGGGASDAGAPDGGADGGLPVDAGASGLDAGAGLANVWVGAAGSCTRSAALAPYDAARSCGSAQSFDQAYRAAQPGDLIGVLGGTYPGQQLSHDPLKGTAGPMVTFIPSGTVYIFAQTTDAGFGGVYWINGAAQGLQFGGLCQNCAGAAVPSWITFEGGPNKDFVVGDALHEAHIDARFNVATQTTPDHLVLRNMRIGNAMPNAGVQINFTAATHVTLDGNIIGPTCCGSRDGVPVNGGSPVPINLSTCTPTNCPGQTMNTNVTITRNKVYGGVTTCADWPSSGFGPCPAGAVPCPNSDCHGDLVHVWGSANTVISYNEMYGGYAQGIFFEAQNGGYNDNVTVESNIIGNQAHGGNGCSFCANSNGTVFQGTWNIRFNTFQEGLRLCGNADPAFHANFVGNLGGSASTGMNVYAPGVSPVCNVGSCTGAVGPSAFSYAYNLWRAGTCDATDMATATDLLLVNASQWPTGGADFHLAGAPDSTAADDFVPTTVAGGCPARDVDDHPRPAGTRCEAGAQER